MKLKHLIPVIAAIGLLVRFGIVAYSDDPQPQYTPQMTLPIKVTEVYDGDTITVEVKIPVRVRLLDCWAPEVTGEEKPLGIISRDNLRKLIEEKGPDGVLVVDIDAHGVNDLGDLFTFGRILGRVKVGHPQTDLSEYQVRSGQATKERK